MIGLEIGWGLCGVAGRSVNVPVVDLDWSAGALMSEMSYKMYNIWGTITTMSRRRGLASGSSVNEQQMLCYVMMLLLLLCIQATLITIHLSSFDDENSSICCKSVP